MLQRIHCQYNRYESALDDTLIGIESLSLGYLTHHVLDPKIQYYGNLLTSLTNTIDDLLLQLPMLIKLKVQVPMSLCSMETAPVTLDAETYTGVK